MEKEKELYSTKDDTVDIKLYEENKSIKNSSILELSITKCPINCNYCKMVYSNKSTGIRIVCKCNCHFVTNRKTN